MTGAAPTFLIAQFPVRFADGLPTGCRGGGRLPESPYGTFDQGGNVWEWNEAILHGSYYLVRGGAFNGPIKDLHASYRGSSYGEPTSEYDSIGFRVCEVPEPATLTLLALGGLAVVRRRRA